MNDMELLREFASRRSEEAFRTLVERHIDFVYAVAFRQLRDGHAAEEVTQAVFIDLAGKAALIPPQTILSGWLFRAARFAAAKAVRSEVRRKQREWEAIQMEPDLHQSHADATWEQMEPALNEALEELSESDRSAVLLRFFEKKSLRDVGEHLGLNEETAKKRVARAVEKLRLIFRRRGIAMSSTALLAALLTPPAQAAPIGLTASIVTNVVVNGTALTTSTLTVGKGILNLMALSKAQATAAAAAALLLVGGTTTYVVIQQSRPQSEAVAAAPLSADDLLALEIIETMNSRALDGAPPLVFLRVHDGPADQTGALASRDKSMGKAITIRSLLASAYGTTSSRLRMAGQAPLPEQRIDYLVSLPSGSSEALQQVIREKLGFIAHRENREEEVYVLTARTGEFAGRQLSARSAGGSSIRTRDGQITFNNSTMDSLARNLESLAGRPVVNETGLRERFDIFLPYGEAGEKRPDPEVLKKTLGEQLGLELQPAKRQVEVLIVQNVKNP